MRRQFVRFAVVGGLCASLNLAFLYVATGLLGLHYAFSVTLSFLIINYVGFWLNKTFTFGDRSPRVVQQAARYYAVMGASLAANLTLMFLLVERAGIHYLISAAIVTVLFFFANFLGHRVITFASTGK